MLVDISGELEIIVVPLTYRVPRLILPLVSSSVGLGGSTKSGDQEQAFMDPNRSCL